MAATLRGLEGKNVLITGAAKGQGFSHAKAFADAGADIAALDITEPIVDIYPLATAQMMTETVAAIEDRDRRVIPLPCDIRDEGQVQAAVGKALDFFDGRIDVLVCNAGVAALDSIQDMRGHVLDAVIDTIVKGHMYVAKYVVPNMIARGSGKIVNISSGVTGSGHAMLSHYVAAKHAMEGLTSAWAFELAEFGINVNAVAPATIKPGARPGVRDGARAGGRGRHDPGRRVRDVLRGGQHAGPEVAHRDAPHHRRRAVPGLGQRRPDHRPRPARRRGSRGEVSRIQRASSSMPTESTDAGRGILCNALIVMPPSTATVCPVR